MSIADALDQPSLAVERAASASFSRITPQYPGVRAPVDAELLTDLLAIVSDAAPHFGLPAGSWRGHAWYSIVTTPAAKLAPIQRLPHVDGTNPWLLALILHLHRTPHGGTNFYRHRATGFETLSPERWPVYAPTLEAEITKAGLPPARYLDDGAPHFDRIFTAEAAWNRLHLYRGCALHSGAIAPDAPLPNDPRTGRLTINGFFEPTVSVPPESVSRD